MKTERPKIPPPKMTRYGENKQSRQLSAVSFGGSTLNIEQQPKKQYGYIPNKEGAGSQFQSTSDYGSMGVLAHNYLSGQRFFNMKQGDEVSANYVGGGKSAGEQFEVAEIHRYQATNPNSQTSSFVDLDTGEKLTFEQLYHNMYNENNPLVFQTCIERDGNNQWGRLFVVARRKKPGKD